MPKYGRPSSRNHFPYFSNKWSEVQKNAPFGTSYTPHLYTKIIGSKYKKFQTDAPITARSFSEMQTSRESSPGEDLTKRPVLPPIYTERNVHLDINELANLVPEGNDSSQLPQKPIYLKDSEQMALLNISKRELQQIPDFLIHLKKVYLQLARRDVNLTGLCTYREFVDSCYANDIHLMLQLFRVVAALFVAPSRDNVSYVNYEKIISFMGAIYKSTSQLDKQWFPSNEGCESPTKPVYYYDENIDSSHSTQTQQAVDPEMFDQKKLLKLVSEEVGLHSIPVLKIRLACQRADTYHRGTLSAKQVYDICVSENLCLKIDTFDHIIRHCRYMGGGQFNWEDFIDFLEHLQPVSTGLQIPHSKLPIEYARQLPNPTPSWPHSENEGPPTDRFIDANYQSMPPPTRPSDVPALPELSSSKPNQDFSQQYMFAPSNPETQTLQVNNARPVNPTLPSARPPLPPINEPWFNRFLKFVDGIYYKDSNKKGMLPSGELYQTALELNHKLQLEFSPADFITAIESSSIDNDIIYTNINVFLKILSKIHQDQ